MSNTATVKGGDRTHEITCLAGIDAGQHECTCGNRAVDKFLACEDGAPKQLTCERCGEKTDAGAWIGFVYVGAECLTKEDSEYLD